MRPNVGIGAGPSANGADGQGHWDDQWGETSSKYTFALNSSRQHHSLWFASDCLHSQVYEDWEAAHQPKYYQFGMPVRSVLCKSALCQGCSVHVMPGCALGIFGT